MLQGALFVSLELQGTELVIVNNFDVPAASGKNPELGRAVYHTNHPLDLALTAQGGSLLRGCFVSGGS